MRKNQYLCNIECTKYFCFKIHPQMISYLTLSFYLMEDLMKSDIELDPPYIHNAENLQISNV